MPLELHEVKTDAEMVPLMEVMYESYTHPHNGFWDMFRGPSKEECTERFTQWLKQDPAAHWIYVVDTDTEEVVGATQWNIYETNPFAEAQPPLQAYWEQEGSTLRTLTEVGLNGFLAGRPGRMDQPHFLIQWCGTKSAHRRRGIGMMMMKWGTERADKRGISSFVEATEMGEPLYRAAGFVTSHDIHFDAQPDNPDSEWQACRAKLSLPMHGFFMWRPIGGEWVEGETKFPWL